VSDAGDALGEPRGQKAVSYATRCSSREGPEGFARLPLQNDHPMPRFSQRYGYTERPAVGPSDLIREDAPESIRVGFLDFFEERVGPGRLREVVCKVLRKRPNPDNWSLYPNIWQEVQELVYEAPWPLFYDIVEAVVESYSGTERKAIADQLNVLFSEEQLAWHIVDAQVVLRTGDVTDEIVAYAEEGLEESGRSTALAELRKAVQALSRRPQPDTRDAVRWALGAMEAVARDITGDRNATLGSILNKKGDTLLASPLPSAFEMIWGYASNVARHVDETKSPTLDEAILVVGLVGACVAYLSRR